MDSSPSLNILLTNVCENRCPYCFGSVVSSEESGAVWMTDEAFAALAGFLERSGSQWVKLLGGEPLLHPRFEAMYQRLKLLATVNHVTVFTSARAPRGAIAVLTPDGTSVVVNLNHPDSYDEAAMALVRFNVESLVNRGVPTTLGYNLYDPRQDAKWFVSACEEYGISTARIAVANPAANADNEVLDWSQRRRIGGQLMDLIESLNEIGVRVTFDCVLTPCMFETKHWIELASRYPKAFATLAVCSPALDVHPDLQVTRCFGVGDLLTASLLDHENVEAVDAFFRQHIDQYQRAVPDDRCGACVHFGRGVCNGGCLAGCYSDIQAAVDRVRAGKLAAEEIMRRDAADDRDGAIQEAIGAGFEHPESVDAAFAAIWVLVRYGRSDEATAALVAFESALMTMQPGRVALLRGSVAELLGDRARALGHYRRALCGTSGHLGQYLEGRIRAMKELPCND